MIPLEVLLTFFAASLLLALAPGPDNIFVLTQSALHGRTSGLIVTVGLCTGLIVHTLGVALGVAVIFQASAVAFTALKLCGAAYLLYLAWQIFRASATRFESTRSNRLSYKKLYSRGIIMNVTNPKVSIFFLAFLPQFTDPARGSVALQTGLLGLLFILSALLVFGGIALLAGSVGEWLNRSTRIQKGMNWLTGSVFIGLALKLVTTER
jgi:threonine/homoserine/homoserine lactone efflux protein